MLPIERFPLIKECTNTNEIHYQYKVYRYQLMYSCNKIKKPFNSRCCNLWGRISQCPVCMYALSLQCSGSVLVNIFLRGGAIPYYVWVSSTVNCQPFVCLSIHLIANNHYPALSSWQMIDVVLKSDGWPCHSDVQACIKNHLYEMPVSLMKRRTRNRMRAHTDTEECMHADKGENERSDGKPCFNSTTKHKN